MVIRVIKSRWGSITDNSMLIIPEKIKNYANAMSKSTGLDLREVIKSIPVKNYRDKMWLDR